MDTNIPVKFPGFLFFLLLSNSLARELEHEADSNVVNQDTSDLIPNSSTNRAHISSSTESKGDPYWLKDAIRDIAYYLRAHKFNEFDRRYNRVGTNVARTNFQLFPKPPLRSLHWEVHRYCDISFLHCVDYLRKKLEYVAIRRQDDTSILAQESNWGANASIMISRVDIQCRRLRNQDEESAPAFEGPLERFQWRTTASYFMCWYTMMEVTHLKHLDEKCDNHAFCLDMSIGPNNGDARAVDSEPFECAQYSFCPDPCCPMKHLLRKDMCFQNPKNPCIYENPQEKRHCSINRLGNKDFTDLILNRWNVSCECPKKGYEWSSMYGICIDVDECASNSCNGEGQTCLNLPGSFTCICKWGYVFDENDKKCVSSHAVSEIKLESRHEEKNKGKNISWRWFMRAVLKVIGKPSSANKRTFSVTFFICTLSVIVF